MKTDIEIARECTLDHIGNIAKKAGVHDEYVEYYGNNKAKISLDILKTLQEKEDGKLILVTAISPTPLGEGKTTTTVGLGDALSHIGKSSMIALREPSLGPVFGIKGGAAGGGHAQVVPMEDINLHFTGDFHAITSANNLLAALIDNHIHQGNALNIDGGNIIWKRCIDMNDRQLRNVVDGLGGKVNGVPREDGFDITVASEIMATLCLSNNLVDLKENLAKIIVAYNKSGEPIRASDLKAQGAMAMLLKDAIKPNLVQTLEHTPTLIHGGPFANIAHGCNSVIATKMALKLADYVVTEAGFGADLGAEKFLDIKCRKADLKPSAVVIVATVRALKHHGGTKEYNVENLEALEAGLVNLEKHAKNIKEVFGLPCVVAINEFPTDTAREIDLVIEKCANLGIKAIKSSVWADGGRGGVELANEVVSLCEKPNTFEYLYDENMSIKEKIDTICKKLYGASSVNYLPAAQKSLKVISQMNLDNLLVCMAKTQYSFSDNKDLLGAPSGFEITIKNVKISAGAGFVVALTGDIMTMPGLPKVPAAENMDIDDCGNITGLF